MNGEVQVMIFTKVIQAWLKSKPSVHEKELMPAQPGIYSHYNCQTPMQFIRLNEKIPTYTMNSVLSVGKWISTM